MVICRLLVCTVKRQSILTQLLKRSLSRTLQRGSSIKRKHNLRDLDICPYQACEFGGLAINSGDESNQRWSRFHPFKIDSTDLVRPQRVPLPLCSEDINSQLAPVCRRDLFRKDLGMGHVAEARKAKPRPPEHAVICADASI